MAVKRIVANIATANVALAKTFYTDFLELNVAMDQGWIMTFANDAITSPQISVASEGGSGTPVPDLSIEVDNLQELYQKFSESDFAIEYELTKEPWGLSRFYVRDPFGKLVNILSHE